MPRADARSRKTSRPCGVAFTLQIIEHQIDPAVGNCALNLFASDTLRSALANELKPRRPKVAGIIAPNTGACERERLAGATAGPEFALDGPVGELRGVCPSADAREEVTLSEASQLVGPNSDD